MSGKTFKASLSKSKGRDSWCVIFKHPIRSTKDGKPGLRVRKGLGTNDQDKAQQLVDQLNEILSDEKMWSPSERPRAEQLYHEKVVAAFYDKIIPEHRDPWRIREKEIPLPSKDDGYVRTLMVGTTGAGKTTVVRQLIGTDPEKERFPSTSSAKTTISNIELITTAGPAYRAVVSFFDKNYVRQHIEECVMAAIMVHLETGDENEVENKFLVHSEQRFRLSYLLGSTKSLSTSDENELTDELIEDDDYDEDIEDLEDETSDLSQDEKEALLDTLRRYLSMSTKIAGKSYKAMADKFEIDLEKATKDDIETLQALIRDELNKQENFHRLVDEIFDDVESKFDCLELGSLTKDTSRWPSHWVYETENRKEFIKTINLFSSNYALNFGRLLTPLVEGLRVAAPLKPPWFRDDDVKLVLIDGEGLGHVADSVSSISTNITKRFQISDAIVLVDNAAQPMLTTPTNVLQTLVSSGHHRKLIVCFTHFDEVKGANIPKVSMRMDHVLDSFDNSVASIGKTLGQRAERVLKECKTDRIFFFSKIQNKFKVHGRNFNFNEFKKMLKAIAKTIEPPIPAEVMPVYDDSNLVLNIQKAAMEFHKPWEARLSLKHDPKTRPEHWARIKALTRRLGEMNTNEYKGLQPVADLIYGFQTHLYLFIQNPISWDPDHAPEEMKQTVIDNISQKLDSRLHDFFSERLFIDKIEKWYHAYSHRGSGSTRTRAYDVKNIYNEAAPIPGEVPDKQTSRFVKKIRTILQEAVGEGGGRIEN